MSRNIDIKLLPHQKRFLTSESNRVLLLAGRSAGKSYIASIVSAMSMLQGKKGLVFAQNYGALSKNLFKEIETRLQEWKVEYDFNHGSMCISTNNGGLVYGYSYENIESVRGLTDMSFAICDEIALAPPPETFFGTVVPCLRGKGIVPKFYMMTTPRGGSSWNRWFKDSSNECDIITATIFDNKFISEESLKLITESVQGDMKRQELYGELLDMSAENCIVDMNKIATKRLGTSSEHYCGIDFARYGCDNTCFVVRDKYGICEAVKRNKADTDELVKVFSELNRKWNIKTTFLDSTGGYDIGFYDRLKNMHKFVEVNFGAKANDDTCANMRAEIYFNLANGLEQGFYIDDKDMLDALRNTSYFINASGKKQLVPKERIKEIIGHSPDELDALALSFGKCKEYSFDANRAKVVTNFLFH